MNQVNPIGGKKRIKTELLLQERSCCETTEHNGIAVLEGIEKMKTRLLANANTVQSMWQLVASNSQCIINKNGLDVTEGITK